MKNFTKKIRRISILLLLSLLSATVLLFITFTMSKYVVEERVGALNLDLTSVDVLLPGREFRNTLDASVTKVVFGRTENHESEIVGIEPITVDVKKEGKIKLYANGTEAYVLSSRKIYANPNCVEMFVNLWELTTIDFFNFDTGIVTDMSGMFSDCYRLTSLDLSSWKTANATTMNEMFYGCYSLASLDLSSWNTASVTTMNEMFAGCGSLTSLDLSLWNTASVTNMQDMFYYCHSLESLNLSGWNTESVTNMSYMFFGCGELVTIHAGNGWNTDKVTESAEMFKLCTKLLGGAGTSYDGAHTDKTYARIDGGAAIPGYFTGV